MLLAMISAIENNSDKDFMLDIYQRYNKLIRKTIYKIVKNSNVIEDLTNDVFIKLIEKISTIHSLQCHKLTAYIVYTSRNTAINYIKHQDVMNKHLFFGEENDLSEDIPDSSKEFENELIRIIDVEALCKSIQLLPEKQKEILCNKYFLEMTDVDIAKSLGISPGSVRQYLKRARDAAKLLLGKEADTYAK